MPRQDLIRFRRGTAAEWAAANPVLADGEPGHEIDTGVVKIGDGVTAWNSIAVTVGAVTGHDAFYAYAADLRSNGTLVNVAGTDAGLDRWALANAATQRVKAVFAAQPGWDNMTVRFGWTAEDAGTGDVRWQVSYVLFYPILGESVNKAATVAATFTSTVPSQLGAKYEFNTVPAIATPVDGSIGSSPFVIVSVARLGADAADTYAGAAGVFTITATRT